MGAKNPAIVLADADLGRAAPEIVSGALSFNGQRCTAIKHVLVERRVADGLVERLAGELERLRVGMLGEELAGLVEDALAKGAGARTPPSARCRSRTRCVSSRSGGWWPRPTRSGRSSTRWARRLRSWLLPTERPDGRP
jgi:hypothetical protein